MSTPCILSAAFSPYRSISLKKELHANVSHYLFLYGTTVLLFMHMCAWHCSSSGRLRFSLSAQPKEHRSLAEQSKDLQPATAVQCSAWHGAQSHNIQIDQSIGQKNGKEGKKKDTLLPACMHAWFLGRMRKSLLLRCMHAEVLCYGQGALPRIWVCDQISSVQLSPFE